MHNTASIANTGGKLDDYPGFDGRAQPATTRKRCRGRQGFYTLHNPAGISSQSIALLFLKCSARWPRIVQPWLDGLVRPGRFDDGSPTSRADAGWARGPRCVSPKGVFPKSCTVM